MYSHKWGKGGILQVRLAVAVTSQAVIMAGMMIIPVITQFGIAQSNSKDHFTPGNAFYALCVQKVQRGMAQSGQGADAGS